MAKKVTKGYGTKVAYSDVNDDGEATGSYTDFARVTNFGGIDVEADDIDVSHLESPNAFKEFIAGWADGGELEIDVQFHKDGADAVWALYRLDKSFQTTFVDGSTWTVGGYIKKFGQEVEKDGIISTKLTVKVSGEPIFAAAS